MVLAAAGSLRAGISSCPFSCGCVVLGFARRPGRTGARRGWSVRRGVACNPASAFRKGLWVPGLGCCGDTLGRWRVPQFVREPVPQSGHGLSGFTRSKRRRWGAVQLLHVAISLRFRLDSSPPQANKCSYGGLFLLGSLLSPLPRITGFPARGRDPDPPRVCLTEALARSEVCRFQGCRLLRQDGSSWSESCEQPGRRVV